VSVDDEDEELDRGRMADSTTEARGLSVVIFLFAGLIAIAIGAVGQTDEAYITWSDPQPLGLAIFGVANLAAAGLAAGAGRSSRARFVGVLLLGPAILLMNASDSTEGNGKWLLVGAAVATVIGGGVVAGGLWQSIRASRRP
jgi:hypothetical protein